MPVVPDVYAIAGPDGAGKTVVGGEVAAAIRRTGRRTRLSWMRSPRFLTYAPLGIFRLVGWSRGVRHGDHDDVHTDLRRHPGWFHLYAWCVTFDYFLGYLGKVSVPRRLLRRVVICDRFVWDAIVDLSIASGMREGFLETPQGRILLRLARSHAAVVLMAPVETLLARRPILSLDPNLSERLRLYGALAERFGIPRTDGGEGVEATAASVLAHLGLEGHAREDAMRDDQALK